VGQKNILLLFLLLLILPGCAKKVDLGPGYDRTSKQFLRAMRWQDFQGAAVHLRPEVRGELLDSFERTRDLHIVEASYDYSRLKEEAGAAESRLVLRYYILPSTRIREWRWAMDWQLIPADRKQRGTWQVQQPPPAFPGIAGSE